jgi:hypothetical protein
MARPIPVGASEERADDGRLSAAADDTTAPGVMDASRRRGPGGTLRRAVVEVFAWPFFVTG